MALQAFARVVELGGFTKAGDSLQLSKRTVSDLVQSLEKHLGVRLLQCTTRRVTVTADGAAFYERCAHILPDLDEAEASVMQSRARGERQTARRHARCTRDAFHHPKTSGVPALEAASSGVRVNMVAPGPIETGMLSRFTGIAERKAGIAATVPLKRVGRPEEIAQAIVFLASAKASLITGASYLVNGGKTAQ